MKEHPILFSTEMIRAILDGRKTQTRRVCKFEATDLWEIDCMVQNGVYLRLKDHPEIPSRRIDCPYGKVGDRLWVRETTYQYGRGSYSMMSGYRWIPDDSEPTLYVADEPARKNRIFADSIGDYYHRTFPSIYMKKELCRIFLEITNIRVERVQDISEVDAKAEGIPSTTPFLWRPDEWQNRIPHTARFACFWELLNSKRGFGWDKKPWVWVIEFKIL